MTNRRILVRAGKHPFTVLSPEAALASDKWGTFAGNMGNVLFIDSVIKAASAPGVEVVPNGFLTERPSAQAPRYADRVNAEFDALVLPMANAFKPKFLPQLETLATVVERLDVPVSVVGIGVQFDGSRPDAASFGDTVNAGVRRFVSAVLDRSASIGVRGETTAQYLRTLGFSDDQVDVIGCPSLFRDAAPTPVSAPAPLDGSSRIALNVTPKLARFWPIIMRNLERYPHLTYIPQEFTDYVLQMYGEPVPYFRPAGAAEGKVVTDPRAPLHWDHPLYQQDRTRCFVDASTWFDYLRQQDFAFGTRLHGNVAALVSGVPAVLLTHDSRTQELAEYHRLPARALRSVPKEVDAAELAAEADYEAFNTERTAGFARYVAFLEKNGVDHVFAHEGAADAWERELASREFPGPIPTLMAPEHIARKEIAARLAWLRQGTAKDNARAKRVHATPFNPTARADRHAGSLDVAAHRARASLLSVARVDLSRVKRRATQAIARVRGRDHLLHRHPLAGRSLGRPALTDD